MGFYGSNDPTDSVKALKEVAVLRTGFNSTRSTSPCYNTTHACNNTYTKMNVKNLHQSQSAVLTGSEMWFSAIYCDLE